jgi:hypothetical protein
MGNMRIQHITNKIKNANALIHHPINHPDLRLAVLPHLVVLLLPANPPTPPPKVVHDFLPRAMGMNSNYIFINLTGYLMYAVYNVYGWVKGNNPETGLIDQSDILFSMHSVLAYVIIVGLFFYYPHQLQLS